MTSFWDWTFYANPVSAWTIALAIAVVVFFGLILLKRLAIRQLRFLKGRIDSDVPPVVHETLGRTRYWFLALVGVWAGSLVLLLPLRTATFIGTIMVIGLLFQIAIWGNAAANKWLGRYSERNLDADAAAVTTMRAVVFLARVLGLAIVLLVALDNLGVNITALIAGLGVGGIAVALAVQNILGDLFSSLSIVIDKPFVVGDFIIVGDHLGTVEHIGLKTTRVTSLSGEQLVFSNTDLLQSRIRNFKRMNERRIVFEFSVVYQTSQEQVRKIPDLVREIIERQELARFDRAHFKSFGASALVFEAVYHVLVPDFNQYMDVQQAINLSLLSEFEERQIAFAYPTQTLYVKGAGATSVGASGGPLSGSPPADTPIPEPASQL
jgi:small-conductance mechanosensitive channel